MGSRDDYFEVAEDGWPTRQTEIYHAGPVLRYGPGHEEDEYGQLGQSRLDELDDWTPWEISQNDFKKAWRATPYARCPRHVGSVLAACDSSW